MEAGGGKVRIIAEEAPRDGVLHGAIEIRLEPGWKTYWRDPGEAGVPPQISTAGSEGLGEAELLYPAPQWVDDGYSVYAAYKHSVMLPLQLPASGASESWHLKTQLFLGICENICIPVQAGLDVYPGMGEFADDLVAAAFAALPGPTNDALSLTNAEPGDDTMTVTADLPDGTSEATLFLAGGDGWYFGHPDWNGEQTFTVPVFDRPQDDGQAAPVWHYTLVANGQAVSGTISPSK